MRVLLKSERYSSHFLCRIKEHIDDAVLGILIGASIRYILRLFNRDCRVLLACIAYLKWEKSFRFLL